MLAALGKDTLALADQHSGRAPSAWLNNSPDAWQTVTVDLWEAFGGKPPGITWVPLHAAGGAAAVDQVLPAASLSDLT